MDIVEVDWAPAGFVVPEGSLLPFVPPLMVVVVEPLGRVVVIVCVGDVVGVAVSVVAVVGDVGPLVVVVAVVGDVVGFWAVVGELDGDEVGEEVRGDDEGVEGEGDEVGLEVVFGEEEGGEELEEEAESKLEDEFKVVANSVDSDVVFRLDLTPGKEIEKRRREMDMTPN